MDPTTIPPSSPPPPPQNPHSPSDFNSSHSNTHQNINNFKSLVIKLAGSFLPHHQSVIDRRFDDLLPHNLFVPDHPPYADMILTALWELEGEGGTSEEEISRFIEKEYHELPWAHATILNHHLRDLCKKGKIAMTHDNGYIRAPPITKPEPSPSTSPSPSSSPTSSDCSSSSDSSATSPSSSSSSMSWGVPYRRKKKRNIKRRRGKMVQMRGRDRGTRRGLRSDSGRFDVKRRIKVEESEQENEDQHEVTSMEVEGCLIKGKNVPNVSVKISEEESLSSEKNNKKQRQPQKKYNVTWIGRRARKQKVEVEEHILSEQSDDEVIVLEGDASNAKGNECVERFDQKEEKGAMGMEHDRQEENKPSDIVEGQMLGEGRTMDDENLNEQSVDKVTIIEGDVSCAKVDECVLSLDQKEEKRVTDMEHNQQEDNQPSDVVEGQTLGEERVTDDVNLSKEQVRNTGFEKQHGGTFEEQMLIEPNTQLDFITNEQVEMSEQSADPHNDDDVTKEPIHPECNVSKAKVDEVVERLDQKEEKLPSDIVEEQTLAEERVMDDEKLSKEQVTNDGGVEKQDGGTFAEQMQIKPNKQLDCVTNENVEMNEQSVDQHDDDVTEEPIYPKCDVSNAKVDECVEQLDQKEENQPSDIVEEQTSGEERVRDDENRSKEQVTNDGVEQQHGGTLEEQMQIEPNKQLDCLAVEMNERSADSLDEDVTKEPIHPECDASNAKVDEGVERLDQKEENQQSDVVEEQTVGEEWVMDDKNLSKEQVTDDGGEKQHGGPFEEQMQIEPNKQLDCLTNEQVEMIERSADSHDDDKDDHITEKSIYTECDVSNAIGDEGVEQLDQKEENQSSDIVEEQSLREEQVMDDEDLSKEQATDDDVEKQHGGTFAEQMQIETNMQQSADPHDDEDVTKEPIHQQCVENTGESPPSCDQDQLKNVETESTEQEEHQTEVNKKETVLAEVQQAPFIEMIEHKNQSCIQQSEISEKDSLQDNNNLVRNEENATSSSSATEGSRRSTRPGLRSSSKKEGATSHFKKQVDLVTPVRRSPRSHKTVLEAAVITEVPVHSKDEVANSGRTRSSKRNSGIVEAEQVLSTRKTRRTGL